MTEPEMVPVGPGPDDDEHVPALDVEITPEAVEPEPGDEEPGGASVADFEALLFVAERPLSRSELRTVARLSAEEVEAAFDRVFSLQERRDGSYQMFAETPSGRRIWVIWRYDREDDEIPDVFGDLGEVPIFVITAY